MPALHHYELSRSQLLFSAASIGTACVLMGVLVMRVVTCVELRQWWVPVAFICGIAAADFGSGLIHWGADTWGRDDLPVIGRRLLGPFRVHHMNPDDFIEQRFIETNGDVAFVASLALLALSTLRLEIEWEAHAAVFGVGFCGIGMLTNQIHQWAHMPSPGRVVRTLQRTCLILGATAHAAHHRRPYHMNYCITTGWCNRPLSALDFFRRLEAVITAVTGARPREDDRRYEARYG
jgi:ubiquitin-conjugating enzyme E2 variant